MRTMYDSTNLDGIPKKGKYVAAYINGRYANFHEAVKRFKRAFSISVTGNQRARFYDVENGDYTPQSVIPRIHEDRKDGFLSYIYCNLSTWPTVQEELHKAGLREWQGERFWIAWYRNPPVRMIPRGALLCQYLGSPGNWSGPYDESVMAHYLPGIDRRYSWRRLYHKGW